MYARALRVDRDLSVPLPRPHALLARAGAASAFSIYLLPIFGVYTLISVLHHHQDPGDEVRYLTFATNLTKGFWAATESANPQLYLCAVPGSASLAAAHPLPGDTRRATSWRPWSGGRA